MQFCHNKYSLKFKNYEVVIFSYVAQEKNSTTEKTINKLTKWVDNHTKNSYYADYKVYSTIPNWDVITYEFFIHNDDYLLYVLTWE